MKTASNPGISFFEKNLTVWVVLCMVAGVLIGRFLPGIPGFLGRFEYAKVSVPIAVLIWLMIFPMMLKVDFTSIKNVGRNPRGLYVTWIVNWLVKPFTMFGIAALFFYVVFRALIPPELARDYLAGAVLLGAAPCTAMVFVWSHLTRGDPAYTVVQVATNDLIILLAFTPIVGAVAGDWRHCDTLGNPAACGGPFCGDSALRRDMDQNDRDQTPGNGLLHAKVHPQVH